MIKVHEKRVNELCGLEEIKDEFEFFRAIDMDGLNCEIERITGVKPNIKFRAHDVDDNGNVDMDVWDDRNYASQHKDNKYNNFKFRCKPKIHAVVGKELILRVAVYCDREYRDGTEASDMICNAKFDGDRWEMLPTY